MRSTALQMTIAASLLIGMNSGCNATLVTVAPDAVSPAITAWVVPVSSDSLTVSGISLQASDNVGVAGFYLSDTAATPSADASGWSVIPPTSYTFSGIPQGVPTNKTLYAWAKDAAGNVSSSVNSSIIISIPDTTPPAVTAFSLPSAATTVTVSVTTLSATDNVGVSGYMITESPTAPLAADAGWTASTPATFTFAGAGSRTAYAWAKDAAGNVSNKVQASVTITIPMTSSKLLQKSDLIRIGAFRVPHVTSNGYDLHSNGAGLAYNPLGNGGAGSLFISANYISSYVGEISIPPLKMDTTISSLNSATFLQGLYDITDGNFKNIGSGVTCNAYLGGLLLSGSTLVGTSYAYYDSSSCMKKSHFTSSMNLSSAGDFAGMFTVGVQPRHVGGWITAIPLEYQAVLGGNTLSGLGAVSILSTTSNGPAAYSFDVSRLGLDSTVNATALIDYPGPSPDHRGLGDSNGDPYGGLYFNGATRIYGMVFVEGTRSVLYFGTHGYDHCYGQGENVDPTAHKTYTCGGATPFVGGGTELCCYDPDSTSKGEHAYPYHYYVWAYNVDDLIHVKNADVIGTFPSADLVSGSVDATCGPGNVMQPWCVRPYAVWTMDSDLTVFSSTTPHRNQISSATYDPVKQQLYLTQGSVDDTGVPYPLVQVYQINTGATLDNVPPLTTASLPGGTYAGPQSVTLSCTDNVACSQTFFTTNGDMPTMGGPTTSPYFGLPIAISSSTVFKFLSIDTSGNVEGVNSVTYTIQPGP